MTDYYLVEHVNPEPWESPQGQIARHKTTGKLYVQMHKPDKVAFFQEAFRDEFSSAYPAVERYFDDGEDLELYLYVWRNMAKEAQANVSDATNMQKAIEDALQGLLFYNDRQVKSVRTVVMAQGPDVTPAVLIGARPHRPPKYARFAKLRKQLSKLLSKAERSFRDNLRDIGDSPF